MKLTSLAIPGVLLIEPTVHKDDRGFFFESFNQRHFDEVVGEEIHFVQDNHSKSVKGVLRGLHFQDPKPQGKLVRVIQGEVFDVAVDVRKDSPTFGKSVSQFLSAESKRQLWIPEGFAHGFMVLSDTAELFYKTTNYYTPEFEHCIIWNDPALKIGWPTKTDPILSVKDRLGKTLSETFKE